MLVIAQPRECAITMCAMFPITGRAYLNHVTLLMLQHSQKKKKNDQLCLNGATERNNVVPVNV